MVQHIYYVYIKNTDNHLPSHPSTHTQPTYIRTYTLTTYMHTCMCISVLFCIYIHGTDCNPRSVYSAFVYAVKFTPSIFVLSPHLWAEMLKLSTAGALWRCVTCCYDASAIGLGIVLEQNHHVIAYASRTLTTAERNDSVIQRECLAFVYALKQFCH